MKVMGTQRRKQKKYIKYGSANPEINRAL